VQDADRENRVSAGVETRVDSRGHMNTAIDNTHVSESNDTTTGECRTEIPTLSIIEHLKGSADAKVIMVSLVLGIDLLLESCAIEIHELTLRLG